MRFQTARGAAFGSTDATPARPFRIAIEPSGILMVTGTGFWSIADVDAHFADLARTVETLRLADKRIRVLVDLRGSDVQAPDVVERVGAGAMAAYQPGDRVAIVVKSNLAKIQMRRIIRSMQHEFFVSPDAAETWLRART